MKLLHVTDFHGNRRWFQWVAGHAEEYDLIAFTGDFLDIFGTESLGVQARWITAWARALPRPLLWCEGNHDVESKDAPVSSGRWLERLPGAKKFSASGHLELMGHSFVRINWRDPIPQLRGGDIIVSHAGPAGSFTTTSKNGGMDTGCIDLADAIRSVEAPPWLNLHGHTHTRDRWVDRMAGVVCLNPGMNPDVRAKVPNYITIDTAIRKARWFRDGELIGAVSL